MKLPGKRIKTSWYFPGQAMVEFALTIILFLGLLLAIIEFGRLLQVWVSMQMGAQAGARYAITGQESVLPSVDLWDTDRLNAIKEEVEIKTNTLPKQYGDAFSPDYFHVAVYASDSPVTGHEYPGGPNARVLIDVEYNYQFLTPFFQGWIA